jgi:hypothetical protein
MSDENNQPIIQETETIGLDSIIEVDNIKPNSVVIFRISKPNQSILSSIQNFVSMYGDKLQEKQCSLLVLGKNAQIEVLNEEEMNKAGWEKKNKSLIIH